VDSVDVAVLKKVVDIDVCSSGANDDVGSSGLMTRRRSIYGLASNFRVSDLVLPMTWFLEQLMLMPEKQSG
jgi:hypothetical protein